MTRSLAAEGFGSLCGACCDFQFSERSLAWSSVWSFMNPVTAVSPIETTTPSTMKEKPMKLDDLMAVLAENPNAAIQLMLPGGVLVPAHFHVTEVGRVQKDFIDCGGTIRSVSSCTLQVWVAGDTDHRLSTTRLAKIIELAAPLLKSTELPVEVEYEAGVVSQYPLDSIEAGPLGILLHLDNKHTACLAEDRCGIIPAGTSCCPTPGCC